MTLGVKEVSDKIGLVNFMHYDIGFCDNQTGTITSAESPFGAKCLRPQWVIETLVPSICAGVFQCSVSRGRVFNFLATTSSWAWLTAERFIPLG